MNLQQLFDYFSQQHNLTLLEDEILDIIEIVRRTDSMYAQNAALREKEKAFNVAVEMREAQRDFFKTRHPMALQTSKNLEKQFDTLAEAINAPVIPVQPDLFS